ncbi:MAG: peptidylprolyl isomerase [Gemmatimonadetes bacterium]|nr:peptidylprolyl isomerase [Gemmatimonadota bacterium]
MSVPTTGMKRVMAGLLLCGLFGGPGGPGGPGGLAILGVPGGPDGQVHAQEEGITLEMTTEAGTIEIVLDPVRAPVTVANFLRYVDAGQYNGGVFHRTVTMDNQPNNDVKIEVIQGAVNPDYRDDSYPPNSGFDPIPLERTSTTGLKHVDGAISMARMGPDTATSGFFFCIGDQPELDFGGKRNPDGQGFAAFGRVTRGMDVIRKIQMSSRENQRLTPPVVITKVERMTR